MAERERIGFDAISETQFFSDKIRRCILPGHGDTYRHILECCRQNRFFDAGLLEVKIAAADSSENQNFDLVLDQKRIPFISYPHEWSTEMFRQAALLQLRLNLALLEAELTLKDSHPWNVLFDGPQPYFVDFTSLIWRREFNREAWLGTFNWHWLEALWNRVDLEAKHFYENYRRMFLPYFLFPLYGMNFGRVSKMRRMIFETTLNTTHLRIKAKDVFGLFSSFFYMQEFVRALFLLRPGVESEKRFLGSLVAEIEHLRVACGRSKYTQYYQKKDEVFGYSPVSNWTAKQRSVFEILTEKKPRTVLDIACNTGWFSALAATLGAKVVAIDIDEACVNLVYRQSRRQNLDILPLVMDFLKSSDDVFAIGDSKKEYEPILISAENRLGCDMVLALAIVHHWCLGQGQTFQTIAERLNRFCHKNIAVEFVPLEDPLIQGEKSFFKAYQKNKKGFTWYALENFEKALEGNFEIIRILPSHPEGRVIIFASKKS